MPVESQTAQRQQINAELPALFRFSVAGLELAFVIILALISANTILFFFKNNITEEISTDIVIPPKSSQIITETADYTYLKTVDAFYPENQVVDQVPSLQIPESTLNIKLYGIRARGNGDGTVIFQSQGSVQQLAIVGNEIAPNTVLTAVHADSIEFRRNGKLEKKYLDEEHTTSGLLKQNSEVTASTPTVFANTVSEFVNALALSPYRNGRAIEGFVVGSDADGSLLTFAGLEVADIIKSVNGNELHSWERVTEISDGARSGVLDLSLERRGEPINLSISTSSLGL